MKRIKVSPEAFEALVNKQGHADIKDVTFECPSCKKLQTAQDFMDALNTSFEHVKHLFLTKCIGRINPSKGCGFSFEDHFAMHEMEIVYRDGTVAPVFQPRTAEEQLALSSRGKKEYEIKRVERLSTINHIHIDYLGRIYRLTVSKNGRVIRNTYLKRLVDALKKNGVELNLVKLEVRIKKYIEKIGRK